METKEKEYFDLSLKISPKESEFVAMIGQEQWAAFRNKKIVEFDYTCQGCGYRPLNVDMAEKIMSPHIIEMGENPLDSETTLLCKGCHATQHIDVTIEKDWVEVVNTSYSQKSLIEMSRISSTSTAVALGDIRKLKMSPQDYLKRLAEGSLLSVSKVKVIFKGNFPWGDIY
jgi:hypothetical protein